jgi:hypothetical protein
MHASMGITPGAGIAQTVQRLATGWTTGFCFLERGNKFFIFHSVHIGSGAYTASYPISIWGLFPRVKRPDVQLATHFNLVLRSRKVELHIHSHTRLHEELH